MQKANVVRLNEVSYQTLREISKKNGETMQSMLEKAVAEIRRKEFFAELDNAYANLKSDKVAWQEELEERALFQQTSADNQDDEVWTLDGDLAK